MICFKKRWLSVLGVICFIITLFPNQVLGSDFNVSRYAGSGEAGYQDDHKLKAKFNFPYGLAVDRDGSLIVADSYNNRIRRIKVDTVSTIAGYCDKTDQFGLPRGGLADGPAETARFNQPRGVAVDSLGNIYVADAGNHVIRKITGDKVFTFAGTGEPGYRDGKGSEAQFSLPSDLAVDQENNLYVADTLNHVIRKITPKGWVSTFAGKNNENGGYKEGISSEALFNEPSGIDLDDQGIIYVLDSGNQLVRKIENNKVVTVAGSGQEIIPDTGYIRGGYQNGPGNEARFNFPKGIEVTGEGVIFVADTWNNRIRAITPSGQVITIAGNGSAGENDGAPSAASFNGPVDLKYYAGKLYIADMWNNSIRSFTVDPKALDSVLDFEAPSEAIQVWADGARVKFSDVQPYVREGRLFIPLRSIGEQLDYQAEWNNEQKQAIISRGDLNLTFSPDNGNIIIQDDRVLVQTRYLAEALGCDVDWVAEYRAAVITRRK